MNSINWDLGDFNSFCKNHWFKEKHWINEYVYWYPIHNCFFYLAALFIMLLSYNAIFPVYGFSKFIAKMISIYLRENPLGFKKNVELMRMFIGILFMIVSPNMLVCLSCCIILLFFLSYLWSFFYIHWKLLKHAKKWFNKLIGIKKEKTLLFPSITV